MIKKFNIQLKLSEIIFLVIIKLFAILYGPSMINLFILILLIYFIFNVNKQVIKIKKNELLIFIFPLFLVLYYLPFFNSENISYGIEKSISFLRFFILSFIIYKILITKEILLKHFSIIFSFFSIFLSIDILIQYFNGEDLFGYNAGMCIYHKGKYDPELCERFSGFFGDEFIAGSYLSTFGIFSLFILNKFLKKKFF